MTNRGDPLVTVPLHRVAQGRAGEQQGVTEAEVQFDSETDRHETGHQKADPLIGITV